MPSKLFLKAFLVGVITSDAITAARIRSKYSILLERTIRLQNQLISAESQMQYLVHVLNENGIRLDEFDLIALPSISVK